MNYWWVNHKQTFKQELEGEFIWSPQKKSNNTTNVSYTNLTKVEPGDVVFSYAEGTIRAIGVAANKYTIDRIPPEFRKMKHAWTENGYRVEINWEPLTRPMKPKDFINRIGPLLPKKFSPIQQNGNGNQGIYLAEIGDSLGQLLMLLCEDENRAITSVIDLKQSAIEDIVEENAILDSKRPELVKMQLIKARVGQGVFRQRLLKIESKCRITGLGDSRFLIASHMKPWRLSNDEEKIDGYNGLLLSPHVDSLFDKALITFSESGKMIFANRAVEAIAQNWNFAQKRLGQLNRKQLEYLAFHRKMLTDSVASN